VLEDIVWTDESRFCKYPDNKETCLRKKGEGMLEKNISTSVKFEGMSAMFWGGIFVGGRTSLIEIKGNMDAALYIEML